MTKPQNKVKIRWSPEFAYAIGLITSDGNLMSKRQYISFKSVDKELVEKFKIALGIKNKISKGVRGGEKIKRYFYIYVGDLIFYRFLNSIGIEFAKSKTIKSVEISDRFFRDFLRGLFDGDGTFYDFWDKRWKSSYVYQMAFSSASLNFIQWLKKRLNRLYKVKGFIRRGDGVFNLRYVKRDTRKLFSIMYYGDTGKLLYLRRKYAKIKKALDKDRR